jgi:hypothetical protein
VGFGHDSLRAVALFGFVLCTVAGIYPSRVHASGLQVFYDNFDGGQVVPPPVAGGFSGFTNTESVQGYSGLGAGSNVVAGKFLHNPTGDNFTNTPSQKTTLQLSGLPEHSGIRLDFLLAIVDTWDGAPNDFFNMDVDGANVFRESFTNFRSNLNRMFLPRVAGSPAE